MLWLGLRFLLAFQVTAVSQPTAAEVLQLAKSALTHSQSAAYVVRRVYTDSSGNKYKGHTTVVIAKSPFGFRADHQGDDRSVRKTAVSDGKTTQTITDGKIDERPTFAPDGSGAMIGENDAAADVALTWHLLLDPEYLLKAIQSGRLLYLWQDEIENDQCSVILYARNFWTDYLWISTKTGFPRAIQRVNMMGGPAVLSPRYEITDIHLNPEIRTDTFRLSEPGITMSPKISPNLTNSGTQEQGTATLPQLIGHSLPDVELKDPRYKTVLLSYLEGKPTVITFWASWCAPCIQELAALERALSSTDIQFQIIAIAVQDKRAKALDFIREHAQYRFLFFTDPEMELETSRLASLLGVSEIPVTLLANPKGEIVDAWAGFEGDESLRRKLAKLSIDIRLQKHQKHPSP